MHVKEARVGQFLNFLDASLNCDSHKLMFKMGATAQHLFLTEPFSSPMDSQGRELRNRGYDLAADMGLTFAEKLIEQHKVLSWTLCKDDDPTYVFFNRPVIVGFRQNLDLDPMHILIIYAGKAVAHNVEPTSLWDLYRTWEALVLEH